MPDPAFWDSSALVPLCVEEPFTDRILSLCKDYELVVWWATPVEIAGALARLLRLRKLKIADWTEARERAKRLSRWWTVVQPSDTVRDSALGLVQLYDLRAADSLQLAAALEWCGDQPQGRVFVSADRRLREAALICGFDAPQL